MASDSETRLAGRESTPPWWASGSRTASCAEVVRSVRGRSGLRIGRLRGPATDQDRGVTSISGTQRAPTVAEDDVRRTSEEILVDPDDLVVWYPKERILEISHVGSLMSEREAKLLREAIERRLVAAPPTGLTIIMDWTNAIPQHGPVQAIIGELGTVIARHGSCETFISVSPSKLVARIQSQRLLNEGAAEIKRAHMKQAKDVFVSTIDEAWEYVGASRPST
jgi:hypothetical protein